jgi:hypothetical protein
MIHLRRRLFKTQTTGASALHELLQSMFVSEFLAPDPAKELWIVSPWISDVPLIDNRSGDFDSLNPEWARREIRLAEILLALMIRGSTAVVVTREAETNIPFLNTLRELVREAELLRHLRIVMRDELHTKGIVLSRSELFGSMNLTHNGLRILEESVEFCIDIQDIATRRIELREEYGTVTPC